MYYELLASAGGAVGTSKCKGQSVYKIAKCFYGYSGTIKESQVASSNCLVLNPNFNYERNYSTKKEI
jgi:hypothetical protein